MKRVSSVTFHHRKVLSTVKFLVSLEPDDIFDLITSKQGNKKIRHRRTVYSSYNLSDNRNSCLVDGYNIKEAEKSNQIADLQKQRDVFLQENVLL